MFPSTRLYSRQIFPAHLNHTQSVPNNEPTRVAQIPPPFCSNKRVNGESTDQRWPAADKPEIETSSQRAKTFEFEMTGLPRLQWVLMDNQRPRSQKQQWRIKALRGNPVLRRRHGGNLKPSIGAAGAGDGTGVHSPFPSCPAR